MAKAKKLKSGNYRCLAFSHTDPEGKRHYKSFTAPTKEEAEFLSANFILNRNRLRDSKNWTLGEAVDNYIELKRPVLSPSTIRSYESIRKYSFQDIMDMPISKISNIDLQNAINREMSRKPADKRTQTLSAKSIKNNYGLISSTLKKYMPNQYYDVTLPKSPRKIRSLPSPEDIYNAVKGTSMELPTLLAMWLSFTESEIRGLTKSKSIDGDYITIKEVLINVNGTDIRKSMAKEYTRNRRHQMPDHIKELIEDVDGDIIVPLTPSQLYKRLNKLLAYKDIHGISFHDLRHVSASLMHILHIPEKYAQDRGGWKTDHIMKSVYTETFSEERKKADDIINNYFQTFI